MRLKGKSYGEIGKELGVAKSTLSYWLKGIPLAKKHRDRLYTNRIKNMIRGENSFHRRRHVEIDTIIEESKKQISFPLKKDAFLLFGTALYWAEGSKTSGNFEMTNSDPLLVVFVVKWIESVFSIPPQKLTARLNIYPQQNDEDLRKFWSELSGIPVANFTKSYIKPVSKGYKKNNSYYGTIKVVIPKSTDLKHRVRGWTLGVLREYEAEANPALIRWNKLREVERPINMQ